MIRRTLTAALAVIGLAAAAPLSAAAARPGPVMPPTLDGPVSKAAAAGTCTLSLPWRVAVGRPMLTLYGKRTGTCAVSGNTSGWVLNHPSQGEVNGILWHPTDPFGNGRWEVPAEHPIGSMVWKGVGSINADGSEHTQNNLPVTVKLAAGAWISSARTGDVVTLKGTSLLYSVSTNSYFKRSAAGVFQFRERGSSTWQTLKGGVWTNSKGEVTMAYRYSKVRDYRFSLYSTPISWDLGSAVTTR
ncbi:hypothetical protein Kfla_3318 [Kribbella flavida DSM 17836]|uniref:Uncharacterized protein n=1 Tax=Kribbella flavida (strain DSM 17836 / JCM 10339 / NBRC 14399) TaxID=479435 RepID=D2PKR2_KRIFD|nr:hypothetical protein [Kribbella flavida]ADB32379.1 hypothetical protein Kfla_3318 [Kribbella flavida DSM 17836]